MRFLPPSLLLISLILHECLEFGRQSHRDKIGAVPISLRFGHSQKSLGAGDFDEAEMVYFPLYTTAMKIVRI